MQTLQNHQLQTHLHKAASHWLPVLECGTAHVIWTRTNQENTDTPVETKMKCEATDHFKLSSSNSVRNFVLPSLYT